MAGGTPARVCSFGAIMDDTQDEPVRAAKAQEAFRTISEVAESLDLPQHVLRFWESKFPQVKPLKRGGNRRYYRPADIRVLKSIKQLLHGDGYTIRGVQKLFKEQGLKATLAQADEGVMLRGGGHAPAVPADAGRVPAPATGPEGASIGPDTQTALPAGPDNDHDVQAEADGVPLLDGHEKSVLIRLLAELRALRASLD